MRRIRIDGAALQKRGDGYRIELEKLRRLANAREHHGGGGGNNKKGGGKNNKNKHGGKGIFNTGDFGDRGEKRNERDDRGDREHHRRGRN